MNDIVLKMAEAGVLVELDEAFQHHIRFTPEAAVRERRFRECQAFVRKLSPNTLGVLPLSLVTLDLISPSLLERVLLEKPFRHEGKVLLDWTIQVDKDDPQRVRWDRRELSDFSTLCFSVQQRKASEQISDAFLLLQSCQEYSDTAADTLLDELRKDQMAWVVKSLRRSRSPCTSPGRHKDAWQDCPVTFSRRREVCVYSTGSQKFALRQKA